MQMIINCHSHIFDLECVPQEFRDRFVLDMKNPFHKFVHWLLKGFLPPESGPAQVLDLAEKSILEIGKKLLREMDETGCEISTPLMMDMGYNPVFGGGTKDFQDQLSETAEAAEVINRESGRVRMMPFIAADPRRPNVEKIVIDALADGIFKGVKIYPVMDFYPNDHRLYGIYQYCVDHNHPITTHCSNGGIPGFEDYYSKGDPVYWEEVLVKFPTLTVNLAHNDRTGSDWQAKIEELINAYDNIYTDISCNTEMWYMPRRYFRNIKRMLNTAKISDRVLYGTDWYMGRFLWDETSYLKWFTEYSAIIFWCRVKLTDEELKRLTEDNPKRFLRL